MPQSKNFKTKILGFLIFCLAAFLFLASFKGGESLEINSHAGKFFSEPVSEHIIVFFCTWFGKLATWGIIVILLGTGIVLMSSKKLRFMYLRIIGVILFCFSLASLEYIFHQYWGSYRGPFLAGGYFGCALGDLAISHLSFFGALVLTGAGLVISLALATDMFLSPKTSYVVKTTRKSLSAARLPLWAGSKCVTIIKKLSNLITGTALENESNKKEEEEGEPLPQKPYEPKHKYIKKFEEEEIEEEIEIPGRGKQAHKSSLKVKIHDEESGRNSKKTWRKGAGTRKRGDFKLPDIKLLKENKQKSSRVNKEILKKTAQKIEDTLLSFKIDGHVVEIQRGPVITQFEVLLAAGIKVHRITNLASELAMNLKARSIRIVAPIPGKNTVGIEVPNPKRELVSLRDLLESDAYSSNLSELPILLGKDGAGNPITTDLALMPHLLIAGATGSGKSVAINSIITTFLMTRSPEEVKMILIDPKMVELSNFSDLPQLLCPVVTDMKKAPATLSWLVNKMDERYEILAQAHVRNILSFNKLGRNKILNRVKKNLSEEELEKFPTFLPYIILIVDELADLMMTGGKEIESHIIRLAQKSRAVGIHVILATQRPSVDVITGLIKSNMPCRMSFQVSSKVDSRTILDRNGAEALLGMGDLLFLPPGSSDLKRAQSCFVSDEEIHNVVNYVKDKADPEFDEELEGGIIPVSSPQDRDDLYDEAVRIILETQRGSATLLQRRLEIGYTRASRLIEMMSDQGIIGPFKGSKAREVYYTLEEWEKQ